MSRSAEMTAGEAEAFGPLTQAPSSAPSQMQEGAAPEASAAWNGPKRVLFRFGFIYLLLHCLPFPLTYIGHVPVLTMLSGLWWRGVHTPAAEAWGTMVTWAGKAVFGVEIVRQRTGSGDTMFNWVEAFCIAVLAAAGALAWTLLARRGRGYVWMNRGLRVYMRFYLASVLLSYGLSKVIQSQFPAPSLYRLMQPYGDSSPMGLLWTFMGASYGYNLFTGLAEVVPAILLTFRRTAMVGALLAAGVMTQVFVLNLCYDVPVKLFSFHLVIFSLYVAWPALKRLVDLLVLARTPVPLEIRPLFRRRWMDLTLVVLRTLFVALVVTRMTTSVLEMNRQYRINPDTTPLYGVWEVEEFWADGEERPPLLTDTIRWRRVIIERPGALMVQQVDGRYTWINAEVDLEGKTLTLTMNRGDGPTKHELALDQPEPDVLTLDGFTGTRDIRATLRRKELTQDFLLTSRGFRLIQEIPFNR